VFLHLANAKKSTDFLRRPRGKIRRIKRMNSSEHRLTGYQAYRNASSPTTLHCNTNPTDSAASRGWIKIEKIRPKRNQVDGAGKVNDLVVKQVSYG
jgi:hypothetical protein